MAPIPSARPPRSTSGRTPTMERRTSAREAYLDDLKVIVIAAIIVIHGILSYSGLTDAWSYTSLREVTLSPVTEVVLIMVFAPFGYIVMSLLFLVAGLLAPPSLEHRGAAPYVRIRLLRLGVPFVAYVLLVQPAVMYGLEHPLGAAPGSYWSAFLGQERQLDTGPLWFVGVLLIFSVSYAALAAARRRRPPHRPTGPIRTRTLVFITAAVVPMSFLVRLVYPYGSESGFTDLNFWEWPACAAAFGLGVAASARGWIAAVPDPLWRRCRTASAAAAAAMILLLTLVGFRDMIDEAMGGWHWAAALFALVEGVLAVFGAVWLLGLAQRRLSQRFSLGPVLGRSAYGAFIMQAPILIGIAIALRPLPLPAEPKALMVSGGGLVGSFALAWLLIRRVPGVARIL